MPTRTGPRLSPLIEEIHSLHARQCELASRLLRAAESESRELVDACQASAPSGLPELSHFKSVFDQQEALQTARRDPRISRRWKLAQTANWFMFLAVIVSVHAQTQSFLIASAATVVFAGLLLWAEQRLMFHEPLQRCLREQLVARGVPLCIGCGYDLRGQCNDRCPECGRQFDPAAAAANQLPESTPCPRSA